MLTYTKFHNNKTMKKAFASVFNEMSAILGTQFLGNKSWIIGKKAFAGTFLKHDKKEEEKKQHKQL